MDVVSYNDLLKQNKEWWADSRRIHPLADIVGYYTVTAIENENPLNARRLGQLNEYIITLSSQEGLDMEWPTHRQRTIQRCYIIFVASVDQSERILRRFVNSPDVGYCMRNIQTQKSVTNQRWRDDAPWIPLTIDVNLDTGVVDEATHFTEGIDDREQLEELQVREPVVYWQIYYRYWGESKGRESKGRESNNFPSGYPQTDQESATAYFFGDLLKAVL